MTACLKVTLRLVILSLLVAGSGLLGGPAQACSSGTCAHERLVCDAGCGNDSNCIADCYDQYLACLSSPC